MLWPKARNSKKIHHFGAPVGLHLLNDCIVSDAVTQNEILHFYDKWFSSRSVLLFLFDFGVNEDDGDGDDDAEKTLSYSLNFFSTLNCNLADFYGFSFVLYSHFIGKSDEPVNYKAWTKSEIKNHAKKPSECVDIICWQKVEVFLLLFYRSVAQHLFSFYFSRSLLLSFFFLESTVPIVKWNRTSSKIELYSVRCCQKYRTQAWQNKRTIFSITL